MPNTYNPQNIIDTGLGGIFGIALAGINDERQIRQQRKLQEMQIAGQKDMMDYSMSKQMQMWLDTNYDAQVDQLNKAGLNPGLLYGMKGGGGVTTGNPQGSVTGGQAPQGGREVQDAIGMGIQMRLLQAQEQNIRADTELKKADATKRAGVDTQATIAQTSLLAQELDNKREDFQIKRLEQTMMNMKNFEQQTSQEDRMDYIEYQTKTAMRQLQLIQNQLQISDATIQDQITKIQAEAIGAGLQNQLTKAQTDKTKSDITINEEQIRQWIQANMREWDKMAQENRRIAVQELLMQHNTDPTTEAMRSIGGLLDNIFIITPKVKEALTPVQGFGRGNKY